MLHVGISGPIAAGKSTLAADLKKLALRAGYNAEVVPFAYGIRELVALEHLPYRKQAISQRLFDWGYDNAYANTAAEMIDGYMSEYPTVEGVKNRRLLQLVGTEVGRQYLGEDAWIIRTQQVARRFEALDFLFSDDLRFDNEAMAVDVHLGIVVRGEADEMLYKARLAEFGADYVYTNHASEQSLTLPPLFELRIAFSGKAVEAAFIALDRIRRLRI